MKRILKYDWDAIAGIVVGAGCRVVLTVLYCDFILGCLLKMDH